jgi:hypothetical protein
LTAGGQPPYRLPYDAFWGSRYAIVEDPGGLIADREITAPVLAVLTALEAHLEAC